MRNKWKVLICGFVVLALAVVFFLPTKISVDTSITIEEKNEPEKQAYEKNVQQLQNEDGKADISSEVNKEEQQAYIEEKVVEKIEEIAASNPPEEKKIYCTLSVLCDLAIKANKLDEDKLFMLPADGIIYSEKMVEFTEGETAFDVMLREMQENGIHMEYQNTPGIGAVYLEGIANLYEFDCGELSGWMYLINDKILSVSCSKYVIKDGDKIEFRYTCDMGNDFY